MPWIKASYGYERVQFNQFPEARREGMYLRFLNEFRRFFHPDDLVEAFLARAWQEDSKFRDERFQEMRSGGNFDVGGYQYAWEKYYARPAMIHALEINSLGDEVNSETSSWWDRDRALYGLPFDPKFDWRKLTYDRARR